MHLLVLFSSLHDDKVPLVIQPLMEVVVMFLSKQTQQNTIYSAFVTLAFIPNNVTKPFSQNALVCNV